MKRIALATALVLATLTGAHADRMDDVMGPKLGQAFATVMTYKKLCPLSLPTGAKAMLDEMPKLKGDGKKILAKHLPDALVNTTADIERIGATKWCEITERVFFADKR